MFQLAKQLMLQKKLLSHTHLDTSILSNQDWEKPPKGKTHAKYADAFIALFKEEIYSQKSKIHFLYLADLLL